MELYFIIRLGFFVRCVLHLIFIGGTKEDRKLIVIGGLIGPIPSIVLYIFKLWK